VPQESFRHEEAVAELLGAKFLGLATDYSSLSAAEKLALLTDVIAMPPPDKATLEAWLPQLTPNSLQSVQVLQALANVKDMVGQKVRIGVSVFYALRAVEIGERRVEGL
jgi:phosphoenolpyruvate carboxylase